MLAKINMIITQLFALDIGFKPESWQKTLPALVIGMIGIFLVIGIIILSTYALNKSFSKKDKDDPSKETEQ